MTAPLVLLVDDHPLFRDGFAAMLRGLRPAWRLASASSIADGVAAVIDATPDLVVIDVSLPDGDGFTLASRIAAEPAAPPRLIVSGREDQAARVRARAAGASGFVSKAAPPETLVAALDTVLAGGTAFETSGAATAIPALTARQAEVLTLLAEGHGNKEIRYRLDIAERTVRAHLTDLFHLLGAHSRTQAVIRAQELGLIG